MEERRATPSAPIAATPWRLFGDFLAAQKVTRPAGRNLPKNHRCKTPAHLLFHSLFPTAFFRRSGFFSGRSLGGGGLLGSRSLGRSCLFGRSSLSSGRLLRGRFFGRGLLLRLLLSGIGRGGRLFLPAAPLLLGGEVGAGLVDAVGLLGPLAPAF